MFTAAISVWTVMLSEERNSQEPSAARARAGAQESTDESLA